MRLPSFGRARARLVTSADVASEVDQHRRLLAEATDALAALDAARREVLLGDVAAAIREHEGKAAELRISVARLEARLDAIGEQAAEIKTAEDSAALTTRRAEVEGWAAEAARWLRDRYPEMAHELVAALTSLVSLEREIVTLNADLSTAGRDEAEHLAGVQSRLGIFPGGRKLDAGTPLASGTVMSLTGATRLLELVDGVRAPGWEPQLWTW